MAEQPIMLAVGDARGSMTYSAGVLRLRVGPRDSETAAAEVVLRDGRVLLTLLDAEGTCQPARGALALVLADRFKGGDRSYSLNPPRQARAPCPPRFALRLTPGGDRAGRPVRKLA
jgi:hypothetical protein